jgi:hypothetical protein
MVLTVEEARRHGDGGSVDSRLVRKDVGGGGKAGNRRTIILHAVGVQRGLCFGRGSREDHVRTTARSAGGEGRSSPQSQRSNIYV